MVVEQRHDHLQVTLGLHEAAHHAEAGPQAAIGTRGHGGDDGMVGALAGRQGVGMVGLQAEIVAAVLQGKSPASRDDAGAKAHVIAVDERAGVASRIHDAEIHRVRRGKRDAAHLVQRSAARVDQLAPLSRIFFGEQALPAAPG